ncbi:MAG TPA: MarC family protein [Solirubrobacteraceae bacterium]|nr:MarC family protein [Solirubrobacteraceae bacterium]
MTVAARVWRAAVVLGVLLIVAFGAIAPPERCPSVTSAELRRSAQAAVDWFVRNQYANGSWLYEYHRDDDSSTPEYNDVRHAGAVMALYQAAEAGLPGALRSADRGTEWALDRLTERDDWAAVTVDGRTTTGTTALLVAGLDYRRAATGDTRYDGLMRRLGRFLVGQIEPSGAVLAFYDTGADRPLPDEYSKYYTGEAYWALARLARTFGDEDFGPAASRIGAYLATARDDEEGYWPPIADHWAEYGMSETLPLTQAELAYARRQAELWGGQARWVQQRFGPWGAAVRGPDVFRGGWYGVMNEGFTGLWRIARAEPELADIEGTIAARASCIAGLAVREQASAADAASARDPSRVEGAWFFDDGVTRMDDQQHALAALLRTRAIVEAGTLDADDGDAPSVWLWALALLLALNPARASFGIPRSGRSSREVAWLCAVGGALGALAICACAVLGDPLLDALDVSTPAFRTAAGVVALLAGATDLFRRPPRPDPALPGRRAALVPVALPLVARPTLLVMALSAGADQGVLVALVAVLAGVAALTAFAVRIRIDGPSGRTLRWAARLLAAGLVACGVLLTIDGILSV